MSLAGPKLTPFGFSWSPAVGAKQYDQDPPQVDDHEEDLAALAIFQVGT